MSMVKVRLQNNGCSGVEVGSGIGRLPPYSTGEKARIIELPAARVTDILAKLQKQVPSHVVVEIMPEENEPAIAAETSTNCSPLETRETEESEAAQNNKTPVQQSREKKPSSKGKPKQTG
jgi:hypothetical protein